jgi:hypothetical protein
VAIKNGQSRETGRIGYTRRREKKYTTQHVLDTTITKNNQIYAMVKRTSTKEQTMLYKPLHEELHI